MIDFSSMERWLLAVIFGAAVFVALVILRFITTRVIGKLAARTETPWDDLVAEMIGKFHWVFFAVVSIYIGWHKMAPAPRWLGNIMIIAGFLQATRIVGKVIDFLFAERIKAMENQNQRNIIQLMSLVVKFGIYVALVLSCLDTLGINVTTLVAGLGIGGIAIALAVQNILSDFISSLSIILDRPFEVGDAIELDTFSGTIEKIGIKTTRARSLTGEEIIFPNSALLQGRIRNFRRMDERRVNMILGVTYETPFEKMRAIPGWIKTAVESHKDARFERAHFSNFNASSMDFEVVYWIMSREYGVFRDVHQHVLLEIGEKFKAEGVALAYPTHMTYTVELPGPVTEARIKQNENELRA